MGEHGRAFRHDGVGVFAGRRVANGGGRQRQSGPAAARVTTVSRLRARDPGIGPAMVGRAIPVAKGGRQQMTATERGT